MYSKKAKTTKKKKWLFLLLLILSIMFFFGAGEEISWGQRIFNLQTPEYLSNINDQNEPNIHNINKKFFDRALDRFTILFVIIGAGLLLMKKEKFLGIQKPDLLIICAFAITPFYKQNIVLDFYHILYLPLIFLLVHSIINKAKLPSFILITTLIFSFLIPIIHTNNHHLFPLHNNSAKEYKEFLFCLCCLGYSYITMWEFKLDALKQTRNKTSLEDNKL